MYHLKQASQDRLAQLEDHEKSRSLRTEIAMIRVQIETLQNTINSDTERIAASPTLSTLFLTLERLLKTAHQIEKETNALLAKDVVILLGREIFQIISDELKNIPGFEEILRRIADRWQTTIQVTTERPLIEYQE